MMKSLIYSKTLEGQFFRWIGWGFVVAVLTVLGIFLLPYFLPHQELPAQSPKHPQESESSANNIQQGMVVTTEKEKTTEKGSNTGKSNTNTPSDFRFTDLALVYFTYCLVIVGWFAIRSDDRNMRSAKRAYIVCAGLYGDIIDERANTPFIRKKATFYAPPWHLMIANYGKTPGYITKIEWGIMPRGVFPEHRSPSDVIKDIRGGILSGRIEVVAIQDIIPPRREPVEYRYVSPERNVGEVFFGRIDYEDAFGDPHYSTFALLHREEHTDTIGIAYTRDKS